MAAVPAAVIVCISRFVNIVGSFRGAVWASVVACGVADAAGSSAVVIERSFSAGDCGLLFLVELLLDIVLQGIDSVLVIHLNYLQFS